MFFKLYDFQPPHSISSKIDETLSESINILKNDYEKKVNDVQIQLDSFRKESREEKEASERRLETLMINKINEINDNLMEQMSKMYHSSVQSEAAVMKKIEDMDDRIKNLNENFETMTIQLEDVQEKMYDFEQNKKNNLIFYGVPGDNRESKDELKHKIANLLKLRLNIRREIPILRASRMLTGENKTETIFSQLPVALNSFRPESARLQAGFGNF